MCIKCAAGKAVRLFLCILLLLFLRSGRDLALQDDVHGDVLSSDHVALLGPCWGRTADARWQRSFVETDSGPR